MNIVCDVGGYSMIKIDGSQGEGGGQILRTSLALSMVTGTSFKINNIRANRRKPGLLRQHLTALNAASTISSANVKGAELGATEFEFEPGDVKANDYNFAVGSAGSVTLVLQTILPPLLTASGKSTLFLEGGTHNPFAPPFDFLKKSFLPIIQKMGADVDMRLERHGFYPAGGGKFRVAINPIKNLKPINIFERGKIEHCFALALVSKLNINIAHRELKVVGERLLLEKEDMKAVEVEDPQGPGNILMLEVTSKDITEVFTAFGERGVLAEKVANKAVDELNEYIDANVPVGEYLADQLLIPMAVSGGGKFVTCKPTPHTLTNAQIIQRFLNINIKFERLNDKMWEIEVCKK